MARAAHENGLGRIDSVDIISRSRRQEYCLFSDEGEPVCIGMSLAEVLGNHADVRLTERVKFITGDTAAVCARATRRGHRYDLAFIDGDHSYEGCRADLCGVLRAAASNCLVVFDDYQFPGVARVVSELSSLSEVDEMTFVRTAGSIPNLAYGVTPRDQDQAMVYGVVPDPGALLRRLGEPIELTTRERLKIYLKGSINRAKYSGPARSFERKLHSAAPL